MTPEELTQFQNEWQQGEVPQFYVDYTQGKPIENKQVEYMCAYAQWCKLQLANILVSMYDVECVLDSKTTRTSFELSQAMQKKKELMFVLKLMKENM